jgi:electron transfer flavoprotein beta subunit
VRTAVVSVKHVPVGGAPLRVVDNDLTRAGVAHTADALDTVSVTGACTLRAAGLVDRVVAVTIGPPDAADALRVALAIGADEVVLVTDDALAGAGVGAIATVLAAAATDADASLLVCGYESADGSSGATPAAAAAILGWPLASRVRTIEPANGGLRATRDLGRGDETITFDLPAVVSIVEGGITPRYPTVRETLAAAKAAIPTRAWWGGRLPGCGVESVGLVAADAPSRAHTVVDSNRGVDAILELLTAR